MFQPDKFSELLDAPVSRPDRFALGALIAWLETQRPDAEYNYLEPGDCLICHYLSSIGFKEPRVSGSTSLRDGMQSNDRMPLPAHWNGVAGGYPWDIKSALLRARAYAASQVQS